MTLLTLTHSTGHPLADNIVRCIVTLLESICPNRITGYYVEGSYTDQTAVATSNLDLIIVFVSPLTAREQELARRIVLACKLISVLELDITQDDEQQLRQHADPIWVP